MNYQAKAHDTGVWTFVRDGVPEDVRRERWMWGVVYTDNTELLQFDNDGLFHQISEVDWKRVQLFVVFDGNGKRIDMPVTPEQQMFFFYRNVRPQTEHEFKRVFVFGWKHRTTGSTVYNFILPDDRIIQSAYDNVDLPKFHV